MLQAIQVSMLWKEWGGFWVYIVSYIHDATGK